jgi:hypothetical protein
LIAVRSSERRKAETTGPTSAPRNILRIVLLTAAAAGLLAVAASVLREKKETVDLTTQQIEDAVSALDPAPAGHFTSLRFQHCGGYKNPLQQCGGVGGCDFEGRRQASGRRIHALMPTGTAGDRRCLRYLLDRLLSSVLNHTPGPLLSATDAAV